MRLSFSQRIWLPLVVSLLSLAALSVVDAYSMRATRLEERKADLVHTTEVALSVVKTYADQAATGAMSTDEAKTKAMAVVPRMRYAGSSGVFSIMNSEGVLVMSSVTPERDGKNMLEFQDANGVPLYQNIVDIAKHNGRGLTRYSYGKPGASGTFPKIGYVDSYRPWDWILTTGAYLDDINAAFRASLYRSFAIFVAVSVLISIVVVVLNRGILRALGGEPAYAEDIATRIANNDLSVVVRIRPDDRGSLLYAMKRMREQLADTITSIKTSAESIASATSQIAIGNQDLSQRTEEQAASLQQTAASMEELTSTANQNSDNARQASQIAVQAMDVAERGSAVVSQVVETMEGINASADKIADIVGIIQGIAFQTNILALNAAVEAARVGAQGRGFAVVASEVRSLAQRASSASKDIKDLIANSVEQVKGGAELVRTAGETMDEITRSVQRVSDIMGEIAAATLEQGNGFAQINQAIMQMDSVTQQNAALVEQAAAAASSLESQADGLRSSVAIFRLARDAG